MQMMMVIPLAGMVWKSSLLDYGIRMESLFVSMLVLVGNLNLSLCQHSAQCHFLLSMCFTDSNGYLYGTDNGPNFGYGDMSTSCTTQIEDQQYADELNLLEKGNYYGELVEIMLQLVLSNF
jgi:hypothetical protein